MLSLTGGHPRATARSALPSHGVCAAGARRAHAAARVQGARSGLRWAFEPLRVWPGQCGGAHGGPAPCAGCSTRGAGAEREHQHRGVTPGGLGVALCGAARTRVRTRIEGHDARVAGGMGVALLRHVRRRCALAPMARAPKVLPAGHGCRVGVKHARVAVITVVMAGAQHAHRRRRPTPDREREQQAPHKPLHGRRARVRLRSRSRVRLRVRLRVRCHDPNSTLRKAGWMQAALSRIPPAPARAARRRCASR